MSEHHSNTRAHVIIDGRVQGVFFRSSTRQKAQEHGVKGYVRNLPDGTVEGVFEGAEKSVQDLISWCHTGPPSARVDCVNVTWEPPINEFSGFSIRY